MRFFKAFDLIVLSYCLATDFIGVFLVGIPAVKLLFNLAVIIVAHKISWRSLIYIQIIDMGVIVALGFDKIVYGMVLTQSLSVNPVESVGFFAAMFSLAPFVAAVGIKFLNRFVPERLKIML